MRDELAVDPGEDGGIALLFDHPTVADLAAAVRESP
jgi:hypothetical protein